MLDGSGHGVTIDAMKLDYPATSRNRDAILQVLTRELPRSGLVLEIASGSGQHAAYFARHLPGVTWQPSSREPEERASIAAYRADGGPANLAEPLALDVHDDPWPVASADAVVCINMIHISPWEATIALFRGASERLLSERPLLTYGPYRFSGRHVSESNERFDASLRMRDPRWGVRDIDDLQALAARTGFCLAATHAMPANNHVLVWRRG